MVAIDCETPARSPSGAVIVALVSLGGNRTAAPAAAQPAINGEFVGRTDNFQLETAVREAGLFRLGTTAGNDTVVGGWIVLNDGDVRGQLQTRPIMANPMIVAGPPVFLGTGNFNPQTGTASIQDGTSNTIVRPDRVTPGMIAILIG